MGCVTTSGAGRYGNAETSNLARRRYRQPPRVVRLRGVRVLRAVHELAVLPGGRPGLSPYQYVWCVRRGLSRAPHWRRTFRADWRSPGPQPRPSAVDPADGGADDAD